MRRIAVCSWSLQPGSAADLVERLRRTGVGRVQLALNPITTGTWPEAEALATLSGAGIEVVAGMMETKGEDYTTLDTIRETGGLRPDQHWPENRTIALENAQLARRMGLNLVTFHAGFLPEEPGDPERTKVMDRLREVVDIFAAEGVGLSFETGQETATTLVDFLEELDRPTAGVNFDPANMILYDKGDPIQALDLLHPWVRQIHIKDATRTRVPGTWGEEVPAGKGEVDWEAFFDLIAAKELVADLCIEREAGDDRGGDIARAFQMVTRQMQRIGGAM